MPQSKSYPTLGRDFVNGVKLLDSDGITIVVEGIGLGDNVEAINDKIDKLVLQEGVDAILGLFGDNGLVQLYEKVNSIEVPTVFARMGAYPDVISTENKYAFTLSYGLCDSLNFLGEWLVEHEYKQVGVSGSFNDAGYGFLNSLQESLYAAGGEFSGHYTPPLNPREDEANFLKEFYTDVKSDAVCQLYNGVFAKENIEYLEAMEHNLEVPLVFMPFGLNEDLLERISKVANEVLAVGTWLPVELTKEPTEFENKYYQKYDKYPPVTGMLGYQAMQTFLTMVPKRKELLEGAEIAMGDGLLKGKWNKDLKMTVPFDIWKMEGSGAEAKLVKQDIDNKEKEYNESFEGQERGWHNAYLCY